METADMEANNSPSLLLALPQKIQDAILEYTIDYYIFKCHSRPNSMCCSRTFRGLSSDDVLLRKDTEEDIAVKQELHYEFGYFGPFFGPYGSIYYQLPYGPLPPSGLGIVLTNRHLHTQGMRILKSHTSAHIAFRYVNGQSTPTEAESFAHLSRPSPIIPMEHLSRLHLVINIEDRSKMRANSGLSAYWAIVLYSPPAKDAPNLEISFTVEEKMFAVNNRILRALSLRSIEGLLEGFAWLEWPSEIKYVGEEFAVQPHGWNNDHTSSLLERCRNKEKKRCERIGMKMCESEG